MSPEQKEYIMTETLEVLQSINRKLDILLAEVQKSDNQEVQILNEGVRPNARIEVSSLTDYDDRKDTYVVNNGNKI